VGLPSDADMGNSEVGHNALGAGRVIDQGAKLINKAIADRSLFEGDAWRGLVEHCRGGGTLHLMGLLSDGNVHSHQDQLHALIEEAASRGVAKLRVHVLLDGRDVPGTSGLIYVDRLEALLGGIDAVDGRSYRIASGGGRMVTTMDRYQADWSVVERGWKTHVHGEARRFGSAREAIETFRGEQPGVLDQVLPQFVVADEAGPVGSIQDGDCVLFFNFRGDRALEISRAFEEGETFTGFDRGRRPDVHYVGMTLYDGDYGIPGKYLIPPPGIDRTLGECLARTGVTQLALSETQKFGHVTYFWNGNRGGMFDQSLEKYVEIPSDRAPFEQRPWMKAAEIADATLEALTPLADGGFPFRFCRINFANGDMVGHSGLLEPTVVAVEAVDLCLARLALRIEQVKGTLLVVADHGNADDMVIRDKQGRPALGEGGRPKSRTSHTLNPVPFIVHSSHSPTVELRDDLPEAGLANVAATVAELLGYRPADHFLPSLLK